MGEVEAGPQTGGSRSLLRSLAVHRTALALAALLGLLTLWSYAPVAEHPFLAYDDEEYVVYNPLVRDGLTVEAALGAFTRFHSHNWHPLTWLSHALDVELFGLEPRPHHLTNVGFHVLNSWLLFALLLRLTGAVGRSGLVAGLFALHPLHVESVAWISERKDVLSTFFGLLSLLAWCGWARGRSRAAYAGALIAYACSLMSKPMWLTLPFALLLFDVWPLARLDGGLARAAAWRRLVLEKWPFFALTIASAVVTLAAQQQSVSAHVVLSARLGNALIGYAGYLRRFVWPSDLAVLYPFPYPAWPIADVVLSAAVLVILTAVALRLVRSRPYLWVGWLFFLGMLAPVSGVVQIGFHSLADRYTYVPLIGLFVAFSWGLHDVLTWRWLRRGLAAALLLGLAWLTRMQVGYWSDDVTLFSRALEVSARNPVALSGVAVGLARRGDVDSALEHYGRALEVFPGYLPARHGLGYWQSERGDVDAAIENLTTVARGAPGFQSIHHDLGRALERGGRSRDAAASYERELARDPGHRDALVRLSLIRARDPDPALRDARTALALAERAFARRPGAAELDVVAVALAAAGQFDAAERAADRAAGLARQSGDLALAAEIDRRRASYADRRAGVREP